MTDTTYTRIHQAALRLALLLVMVVSERGVAWGADLTAELTAPSGYTFKAFYNCKTNTPEVLPTAGDLRYRSGYGLYNFGAGNRSAVVPIPVEEGDIMVVQTTANGNGNTTTINVGSVNEEQSTNTGYQCFDITSTAETVTITIPRAAYVVGILVWSTHYSYILKATDGTNDLGIISEGAVPMGESVTVAYPQYILNGTTLYNIAANSGDYYRKTIIPTSYGQVETLSYNNGTVSNVVYYTEVEDIQSIMASSNFPTRASNGLVGYTGGANKYLSITTIVPGKYKIHWSSCNGHSTNPDKTFKFKAGETVIYSETFGKGNGVNGVSNEFTISETSTLYFACEGSSASGMDWFYIERTNLGWIPPESGWNPVDKEFTISLGDLNENNMCVASMLPSILNPTGDTPIYLITNLSETSKPVGQFSLSAYPPRIAADGDATIRVTAGDFSDEYTLHVVTDEGGGTYDASTRTYTFDKAGKLEPAHYTVSEVPNITMTLGEGANSDNFTAIVVNDVTAGPMLKAIDGNGYSHPNQAYGRASNTIPAQGANGGTYYVFEPTKNGFLNVKGCMKNAYLYEYAGGDTSTKVLGPLNSTSLDCFMEAGKKYYLFNADYCTENKEECFNPTPLLHSFQYRALEEYTIDFSKMNYVPNNNSNYSLLDRTLPGFQLKFEGGDDVKYESNDVNGQIHFRHTSAVGKLIITPRLKNTSETKVIIRAIKLETEARKGTTPIAFTDGIASSILEAETSNSLLIPLTGTTGGEVQMTATTTDNTNHFKLTGVTIYYLSADNGNPNLLLNQTKVAPVLSVTPTAIETSANETGSVSVSVTPPSLDAEGNYTGKTERYRAWYTGDASTDNLSVAQTNSAVADILLATTTVNNTNGDPNKGNVVNQVNYTIKNTPSTKVTVTLAGNEYFADATATFTIAKTFELAKGAKAENIITVAKGQVVRIVAKANSSDGATLGVTRLKDNSHTFTTDKEEFITYAGSDGTITLTNNGESTLTIYDVEAYWREYDVEFYYPPYDDVYPNAVTYVGQPLSPVLTVTDTETGTRYTGKDITDRFTVTFIGDNTNFADFSTSTSTLGRGVGRSDGLTQVSVKLVPKGYYGYQEKAPVASATKVDVLPNGKRWDFRLAMATTPPLSGWSYSNGYYSPGSYEFTAAVNADDGTIFDYARGLDFMPNLRLLPGTGNNNAIRMFTGGSAVRIPVVAGMEIIIRASSHGTRTYSLTNNESADNITDIYGNAVSGFTCSGITEQKFLATETGYVQFTNNSDIELQLLSIQVQALPLHFEHDAITVSTQYEDAIINPVLSGLLQSGRTATYAIKSGREWLKSGESALDTSTGTITGGFRDEADGQEVVISATATGNSPSYGEYTITILNLRFDPEKVTINLDNATCQASLVSDVTQRSDNQSTSYVPLKTQLEKLETDIVYSCTVVSGNPYPRLVQSGSSPTNANYTLICSGYGDVKVTARSDYAVASFTVHVDGVSFDNQMPSIASTETTYTPTMQGSYSGSFIYTITGQNGVTGTVEESTGKLTDLSGNGVIQVTGTNTTAGITRVYNLTRAYSASNGGKDWRFYDIGHGDGTACDYNATTELTRALTPLVEGSITGKNVDQYAESPSQGLAPAKGYGWYLKYKAPPQNGNNGGTPRWASAGAIMGDNGFIISETAGLIFHTPALGFTVRNDNLDKDNDWKCYRHVGLHDYGAKLIIPQLKAGNYIEIKTIRHSDNSGEQVIATNLTDLEGKEVDANVAFGLLGAQHGRYDKTCPTIDHPQGTDKYGLCGSYTFRVKADGDVSFTLSDAGIMDILQVRIYDGNYQTTLDRIKEMTNAGTHTSGAAAGKPAIGDEGGYVDGTDITLANGEDEKSLLLAHSNWMNSTNTGPGKYVMVKQVSSGDDDALHNSITNEYFAKQTPLDDEGDSYLSDNGGLTLNNTTRWSVRNAAYYVGELTATKQSNASVRLQCYTKGWEYMTAYSPVPSVPVGIAPAQTYPYTWDFTNMAGGRLSNDAENAYNTIIDDNNVNWIKNGTEYSLKTDRALGAYYVAGCQLVTKNIIIKETQGLGFDITTNGDGKLAISVPAPSDDATDKKMTIKGIITIPDLNANSKQDYIYIKANARPSVSNATPVENGDAASGVYQYKVTSAGNCNVTFDDATEVSQIGVTDILKPMTKVGSEGWATESRERDIDYTLTGYFTTNAPSAYVVENATFSKSADGTRNQLASVSMGEDQERRVVPHSAVTETVDETETVKGIGLVLRQKSPEVTTDYSVPLFVPAITTPLDETNTFANNLMAPAVSGKTFTSETEDDNTVFILAKQYMTWKKVETESNGSKTTTYETPTSFESSDAAVFYRLHVYGDDKDQLGANKAYLLLPTDQLPTALWNETPSGARRYVAIQGVSDMDEELPTDEEGQPIVGDGRTYNLSGQAVDADGPLPSGVYIRNGKKVVIR